MAENKHKSQTVAVAVLVAGLALRGMTGQSGGSRLQAQAYDRACVTETTQTQRKDVSQTELERLSYFKLPKSAQGLRSEVSVQFADDSRLMNDEATLVRLYFRADSAEMARWKLRWHLEPTPKEDINNDMVRTFDFGFHQMEQCKLDWWQPPANAEWYRNIKDHPGTWLFDLSAAKDAPGQTDVFISGFMR